MLRKFQFLTTGFLVLVFLVGLAVFSPQESQAATIVVDTIADEMDGSPGNGDCSLREAVENANNDNDDQADCDAGSGADIILLPAGEYQLEGASREENNLSGDLDIWADLTIVGADYMTTKIQAGSESPVGGGGCGDCVDRVLEIKEGTTVNLFNLTIRYGKAPDGSSTFHGSNGGGISNNGDLTLNNCVVTLNHAGHGWDNPSGQAKYSGHGGGIYTMGNLTVKDSRITYNRTGDGGTAGGDGYPTWGGSGGGIYALGGASITIINTFIGDNVAGNGAPGNDSVDGDGINGEDGGSGGGINCGDCTLTLLNSSVVSNQTGNGGAGGNSTGGDGDGGVGGPGGRGAGINITNVGSQGIILNSWIHDNQTGQGGLGGSPSGVGSPGEDGDRGSGGGFQISSEAEVKITKCAISNNAAYDGGGISAHDEAAVSLVNSTVSGNMADNNGGGIGNSWSPIVDLTFVTITDNTADYDGDGNGDGGGYYIFSYSITVTNSIIAGNTSTSFDNHDCDGVINSQDYNLIGINSSGCFFTAQANDQEGSTGDPLDPLISSLAFNGGLTPTHALLEASDAVDQIPNGVNGCNSASSRDQRGALRIAPCDIGAYEIDRADHVYLPLVFR